MITLPPPTRRARWWGPRSFIAGTALLLLALVIALGATLVIASGAGEDGILVADRVPLAIDPRVLAPDGTVSVILHACDFQQLWALPMGNPPDLVRALIANGGRQPVSTGDLVDTASPGDPRYWYAVIQGVEERIRRAQADPVYGAETAETATPLNPRVVIVALGEPANGGSNRFETTQVRIAGFAAVYLLGVRQERTAEGAKQYWLDGRLVALLPAVLSSAPAPETTVRLFPPPNALGWHNGEVTAMLTAIPSSGASRVTGVTYSAVGADPLATTTASGASASVRLAAAGETMLTWFAEDDAGKIEPWKSITVKIDRTPPAIEGIRTPAPSADGWNKTDVTVSFRCSDPLSGIASGSAPVTLTAEGVHPPVAGTAIDRAGNQATLTVSGIRIDKTPPAVTYSGNAGFYTVDQEVEIPCAAADSLSGIAAHTCADIRGPAYSFPLGEQTFSATATDRAGNTGSGETRFTVQVTYDSLCSLTRQLTAQAAIARGLCAKLGAARIAAARGAAARNARALAEYVKGVEKARGKALSPAHAEVLVKLAGAL